MKPPVASKKVSLRYIHQLHNAKVLCHVGGLILCLQPLNNLELRHVASVGRVRGCAVSHLFRKVLSGLKLAY